MANTFLTDNAGRISAVALEQLYRQMVLPSLVWRDISTDFDRGEGDTVTIRRPAILPKRRYSQTLRAAGTPIVLDEVTETGVPIVVDTHSYSAVGIPDEDEALNIRDFASQVLAPQMSAVSEDVEDAVAATFTGLAATNDITVAQESTAAGGGYKDPVLDIIKAHTFLSNNKVRTANRFLVMGPTFAGVMLADDRFSRADVSGDATSLQTAAFKPTYGFMPFESLTIPTNEAFAFSREAIAMATVTPRNPRGATASESVRANGMVLRWLSDYDPAFLRDRSIVSMLSGSKLVDSTRIVRMKLGPVVA